MRPMKETWAEIAPRWTAGAELSEEDTVRLQKAIRAETQATLRQLIQVLHCEELLKDGNIAELKDVLDKWK